MPNNDTDRTDTNAVFLTDFSIIWYHLIIWTTLGVGASFFVAGMVASRVGLMKHKWTWLPILTLLFGVVLGFVQGALPVALIAAMYHAIPFAVGLDVAAGIGIGTALVIVYFHLGRGDFIHK
eukprot:TRINITY_DN10484_c0_g1_i1.p1 TRINITY_DN10484_c0_g1~~TRINITY_DN10484_c0_g1_i1.p1  ORF type:complete len:122 (-),score=15.09 TRINITY_DN10484_c0_g1_i1:705-1070(-)